MPVSRHRKIDRAKKRPKGLSSAPAGLAPKARKTFNSKLIVILLIVAIAASAAVYVIANRGSQAGNEITTASGLKYVDLKVGDGVSPRAGQTVKVHYIGSLASGKEFENSYTQGKPVDFSIGVGRVIKGWDEGLMTMKVGGKRRLIIPPNLGYGATGNPPTIPPNATLTFEIELLGVN